MEHMDVQRSGYLKKKYRFYWREEVWHNGGRENEYGVGAQEVFPHLY